ncbi:MAG: hypothetical protein K9N06_02095 [Candidatus Cloacimonetes bacterium]|nr:hypothetical protein [Candidatus Cloacimonadota bacterium]
MKIGRWDDEKKRRGRIIASHFSALILLSLSQFLNIPTFELLWSIKHVNACGASRRIEK